jgi:hypothetical protein
VALHRHAGFDRHQLERPKDDLAEVSNRGHRVIDAQNGGATFSAISRRPATFSNALLISPCLSLTAVADVIGDTSMSVLDLVALVFGLAVVGYLVLQIVYPERFK